jgi:hypothetical protein
MMLIESTPTGRAAVDVINERHRQIQVEGRTLVLDDLNEIGELASAAACYVMTPEDRTINLYPLTVESGAAAIPRLWPWNGCWWKPGDGSMEGRRRELVKGAALALAEIERIDRLVDFGTPS